MLATPVLGITLVLLMLERGFGIGIFDPRIGGDPVLFQHFFWFYSHPAVYIMILPGMAIISELIPTFSRKTIFGYRAIAYSSVSLALVSFIVWGHHMFVAGQSQLATVVFSALTFLVAIPSGVKVFNWLGTMYQGNISLETPMLLRHLLPDSVRHRRPDRHLPRHSFHRRPPDRHLLRGGALPLRDDGRNGHRLPRRPALLVAQDDRADVFGKVGPHRLRAVTVGFNMTFLTQFFLGSQGMPRRYYNYLDQFQPLHAFSTVGSWVSGLSLFMTLAYLLASLRKPMDAPDNPWGGTTLEWQSSSPPITHNFEEQPVLEREPYDYRPVKTLDTIHEHNQHRPSLRTVAMASTAMG